jgi:hypothetical protein
MLGLVFLTVLSGIFITQAEVFEELHEVLPVMAMILAGVHVAGVLLATKMHGENYMLSMINGQKKGVAADAIPGARPVAAVLMLVLVFGGWSYFIKGFNRDSAVFTAPGTQWTYQIGEAEEKGEKGAGERGERESEEKENSERGAVDPAAQGVKADDQEGAAASSEESEKYTQDDDGDDD